MLKKLGYKLHLLVKNPKLWIYKCKINFYKCKNNLLNQIITRYAQKIKLQVTFVSKNPKLGIYTCKINFCKCKITFYKCKLTCDKKLCQVIHSRSEISWKKPKKWIFGFLKFALPVPLPWALKSWAPSNFILSDTFPIFFWCGKLKKQIGLCWGTWFFRGLK